MYTRILDEIASGPVHARNIALECFRWILYAQQTPSLITLKASVALLESPCTEEDLESQLLSHKYILEACRNLLRLPHEKIVFDTHQIAPIHFSFLEYLQNLPLDRLRGNLWYPLTDRDDAESVLACRCMDWLFLALPKDTHWSNSTLYHQLRYPLTFFDKHAIRAISGSPKSNPDLLASMKRLLSADNAKLASLVKRRLFRTPLGQEILGQDFDLALSRNYLMWTSDLYLFPELESGLRQLAIPKYILHFAVCFRPGQLELLLSDGYRVNEPDQNGRTPLWYACDQGRETSVEILLREGATISRDSYGESPLHRAIRNNHLEATKLLLQAKPSAVLDFGGQALMIAASLEMVRFLCEAYNFDINAVDCVGRSVLSYFVGFQTGDHRSITSLEAVRIVDYLCSRGADMYGRSKAGMSLIDYAASSLDYPYSRRNPVDLLKYLLQHDLSFVETTAQQWTSLHWACRKGNLRLAKILIEHGVEVTKVTTFQPPQSFTPYDIWTHHGFQYYEATFRSQGIDESILHSLGRSRETEMDSNLPVDDIKYDWLMAEEIQEHTKCHLCEMEVYVCHP